MSDEFQSGDLVTWKHGGFRIRGKVIQKLVEPYKIGKRMMDASESDPSYLLESAKTGKQAVHKPSAISKV